jgi:hypothetical protein
MCPGVCQLVHCELVTNMVNPDKTELSAYSKVHEIDLYSQTGSKGQQRPRIHC